MEEAMSVTDALILAAIVLAFAVFGIVLAWTEYQTRHVNVDRSARKAENSIQQNPSVTVVPSKRTSATELLNS
jgi:hypothetical protein